MFCRVVSIFFFAFFSLYISCIFFGLTCFVNILFNLFIKKKSNLLKEKKNQL